MNPEHSSRYVLFLSAWYPHRDDFTFGIFVQRHAKDLAGQGIRVIVAWVFSGVNGIVEPEFSCERNGFLTEYCLYYPSRMETGIVGTVFRTSDYLIHYSSLIQQIMQTEGKPARVVLNVAMRAGLLALWLKYTRGVPFILIEHWSGYLPEDGRYHGKWLRKATELVFKEADGVMTVSKQMRDNMVSRHGLAMKRHAILPNSVDVDIFSYIPENQLIESPFFYHVSNFVHEKNVLALVAVFEQCWNEGMQYRLILSGDGPDATTVKNRYIHRIEEGKLQLTGRLTPEKIASYMQQATAFVLFSLFEGLPCVMLEAWCTGLPVIAPATGGIPEVLNSDNGILLPTNDGEALYKAVWAIDRGALTFDRLQIHTQAKAKYASSSVGQTLFNFLQLNNE